MRTFSFSVCLFTELLLTLPAYSDAQVVSVKPSTAIVQVFPVAGRPQIKFVITFDDGTNTFKVSRASAGSTAITDAVCLAKAGPASPDVVFENDSGHTVRVTLRQPIVDSNAGPAVNKTRCTSLCSLTSQDAKSLCDRSAGSAYVFCQPKIGDCGTPECNAFRAGCGGPDCYVDFPRVTEACGCTTSKVISATTADAKKQTLFDTALNTKRKQDELGWQITGISRDDSGKMRVLVTKLNEKPLWTIERYTKSLGALFPLSEVTVVPVSTPIERGTAAENVVIFNSALLPQGETDRGEFVVEEELPTPADAANAHAEMPDLKAAIFDVTVGTSETCLPPTDSKVDLRVALVGLDNTGVASWRYANPRNPACIDCEAGGKKIADPTKKPAGVLFHNRTPDRTFAVALTLPVGAKLTEADEGAFQCKVGKTCTVTRNVPPLGSVLFDRSLLEAADPKTVLRFDVSLPTETASLGNSHAYLTLSPAFDDSGKPQLIEREPGTTMKTKVSLAGRDDPSLPSPPSALPSPGDTTPTFTPCQDATTYNVDNEPVLCAGHPYKGGETQQYKAKGSIQFLPNLGDRADGSATLVFRSGAFGSTIDKVALDEYQINIYGIDGISMKLGKTDFATPTNGLAVSESGEGFLFNFLGLGLGHVVRRESAGGSPDAANRDKKDWFLQWRSITFGHENDTKPTGFHKVLTLARSLDLIALRGEDKNKGATYRTEGFELFFNSTGEASADGTDVANLVGGSVAGYHSTLHRPGCTDPATCPDGRGTSGLLTLSWIPHLRPAENPAVRDTFTFNWGMGTGDRPSTPNVDEGFSGDSASYAPDKLFLSTLIGAMNAKNKQIFPLSLSNKRYLALTYTNTTTSLLDLISKILKVDGDVNSRSTVISLRQYSLLYGRNNANAAAREADVTFQIEVPKGVTWSIEGAYVEPGSAFNDIIAKRTWSVVASVTLSL